MKKVVIASGVRTPIGDFGSSLQPVKPLDLMMTVMKKSLRRARNISYTTVGSIFGEEIDEKSRDCQWC